MSKTHEVKSWPEYFGPVFTGEKPFDIRKNDRDYQVGDRLYMREWDSTAKIYTGRELIKRITYVMTGAGSVGTILPLKGLSLGYAVIGLAVEPKSCAAISRTDPPQDCDWPWCDCDQTTIAVMKAIDEQGLVVAPRGPLERVLEAATIPEIGTEKEDADAVRRALGIQQ